MTKIFSIHCNGYNFESHLLNYLSPIIKPHIDGLRKKFKLNKDMYAGSRYYSNDTVFVRITSALYRAQLEPFSLTKEEISHLINSALNDCARTDYWYIYEKDWG
jgi:hypothetical protein